MIRRLGLLHYFPLSATERFSFALMEYTAAEVFRQAGPKGIGQPFAVATVLECCNNPAFFPAPEGASHGFTVDLSEADPRPATVREVLHIRLDYSQHHVVRFGQWPGPKAAPDLVSARNRHVTRLRETTGRNDFGAGLFAGMP